MIFTSLYWNEIIHIECTIKITFLHIIIQQNLMQRTFHHGSSSRMTFVMIFLHTLLGIHTELQMQSYLYSAFSTCGPRYHFHSIIFVYFIVGALFGACIVTSHIRADGRDWYMVVVREDESLRVAVSQFSILCRLPHYISVKNTKNIFNYLINLY